MGGKARREEVGAGQESKRLVKFAYLCLQNQSQLSHKFEIVELESCLVQSVFKAVTSVQGAFLNHGGGICKVIPTTICRSTTT